MLILSHPMGNQNMRHTALALAEGGMLAEAWICLAWNRYRPLGRLLPAALRAEAERRSFPDPLVPYLRLRPLRELVRLLAPKFGARSLVAQGSGWACIDAVLADLDGRVARRLGEREGVSGVYAYEDGAAASFRAARRLGLRRVYDLPIGYWRAYRDIYRDEEQAEPEWASTLAGNRDGDDKLARKDEELALADRIIVASSYTRSTLSRYSGGLAPVHVVPYGAPPPVAEVPRRGTDGPLRLLFVGGLSQRKGLSYLFRAIAGLGDRVRLTVIGRPPSTDCPALTRELARHRHIASLPHDGVLAEMRAHDLLLFPSLFEGFGLVITEAMSQGVPVLTTPHTAGPDLITDGVDGFIVPIRSSEAIAERIEQLLADRGRVQAMAEAARATAARRSWEDFRARLRQAVSVPAEAAPPAAPGAGSR